MLQSNKNNLQNSSWLIRFIDSDGSFSVQHIKLENGAKKEKFLVD